MNLKKVHIVIKREVLTRVRKKSFLIATFLTPLFMALLIAVPILMSTVKDTKAKVVQVIDPSGLTTGVLEDSEYLQFRFDPTGDPAQYQAAFKDSGLHAVCVIDTLPDFNVAVRYYSTSQVDMDVTSYVSHQLRDTLRKAKVHSYNIPELDNIIDNLEPRVQTRTLKWTEEGDEKETVTGVYMAIAYICSFLIYMFIFIYGSMVIRGVVEEKNNRIVEVILSCVKPVELMMGKVIGVALVAIIQFFLWLVLTAILAVAIFVIGGLDLSALGDASQMGGMAAGAMAEVPASDLPLAGIISTLQQINLGRFLLCFLLYFFGGYFLYASMFAAVGSVSDAETDTQQFQLPITIPLILGLFIMMHTFQHPDSSLSFWSSMIPFTSPMIMLARLPFGNVAFWELALSFGLLVATFIGAIYLSAKIYRVGILLYGKKITWKELWKWIRY